MDFANINWLAVVVAAVAFFILGAIWYGPIFGKAWQKGTGLSDEEIKSGNMGKMLSFVFVMALVVAVGMAMFFFGMGTDPDNPMTVDMGAMYGAMTGIFFLLPSTAMNYHMSHKPASLILIDSTYHIVGYTLIGVILAAWQ